MVVFQRLRVVYVTFSKPHSLSTSEIPGIRSRKTQLSKCTRFQESIGGNYFTKKWRAQTPQPGLEFDDCKPRLESGIFKCTSWLNGSFFFSFSFFWGCSWPSEGGIQDLTNGTNSASQFANFSFFIFFFFFFFFFFWFRILIFHLTGRKTAKQKKKLYHFLEREHGKCNFR